MTNVAKSSDILDFHHLWKPHVCSKAQNGFCTYGTLELLTQKGNMFSHLIVFGVPEDHAVLWAVRLGEGVHHSVCAVAPLKEKQHSLYYLNSPERSLLERLAAIEIGSRPLILNHCTSRLTWWFLNWFVWGFFFFGVCVHVCVCVCAFTTL